MNNPIDLSRLPAPAVIEPLDFETILAELTADLISRDPALADTLTLESEPLTKLLEVAAYRELLLRQRINEAAKAVMLAYAQDEDLEHLAALFDVERLEIDPGDPDATPPVPPTFERNDALRRRVLLSLDGLSTAGPERAYVYHALSASGDVKDADAFSEAPGEVTVVVLSQVGNGEAPAELLSTVSAAVNAADTRPLTDYPTAVSAEIVGYTIRAILHILPGPEAAVVRENALAAAEAYTQEQHRIGAQVTLSGVYAALHQPGVQRVELLSPTATISTTRKQAPYCDSIELTSEVVNG
ncbi:baseplate J/gp47 family protein [Vreelandella lionensis]|uniref:Baseplate J/gp47 family protein n=1 Tax=Vreelandella lionensis TaxID=1144478 RepID=A0ABW8BQ74_9GAMM